MIGREDPIINGCNHVFLFHLQYCTVQSRQQDRIHDRMYAEYYEKRNSIVRRMYARLFINVHQDYT